MRNSINKQKLINKKIKTWNQRFLENSQNFERSVLPKLNEYFGKEKKTKRVEVPALLVAPLVLL